MKRFFFFTLISTVPLTMQAAPLTWEDCLAIASSNNPDLMSARKTLEARRAQLNVARNGIFPSLNFDASVGDSSAHNHERRWDASGSARVDIFNQSVYADIKNASANLDFAKASYRQISATVLFNLKSAFAHLLYAQEQLGVSGGIKDLRDRDSEMISLRYNSGRESKGNMMKAQAEKLEADVNVKQARRDLRAAQQRMNEQLGQDNFEVVVVTGTFDLSGASEESPDFKPLIDNNPQTSIQEAAIRIARAGLSQSNSSLWPNLSANYVRSFSGPDFFPDRDSSWSASGVLSLPLFGNGPTAAFYSIASSRRNVEKAEQDLRSVRNQLASDLQNDWAAWIGQRDQVRVQDAFLAAARQRNGEADVRYTNGLLSYENWALIVTDRVNLERSLIRAQRDAIISEAQWERTSGKELPQ